MSATGSARIRVLDEVDPATWDQWVAGRPNVFQTSAWTAMMTRLGHVPIRIVAETSQGIQGGLVAFARHPGGNGWKRWLGRLVPMVEGTGAPFGLEDPALHAELLRELDRQCRDRAVAGIEWSTATTTWENDLSLRQAGFRAVPLRTYRADLRKGPEASWRAVEQKRQADIRKAQRLGVVVRQTEDVDSYLGLARQMIGRLPYADEQSLERQHRAAWEAFSPSRSIRLFVAEREGAPLAGAVILIHGGRGYYLWGASQRGDKACAPSLLLWEAMRWGMESGLTSFDFLPGPVSPPDGSPAYTIGRFKRTFGGSEVPMYSASREVSPARIRLLGRVRDLRKWLAERRGKGT